MSFKNGVARVISNFYFLSDLKTMYTVKKIAPKNGLFKNILKSKRNASPICI